jgi:hypothetical protein
MTKGTGGEVNPEEEGKPVLQRVYFLGLEG